MMRRLILAGVVLAVALTPAAAGGQGAANSGQAPSFLQLSLVQPAGFSSFPARPGDHEYLLSIGVQVTATEAPVTMTIGDGDASSGAHHGHLVSGSYVLPSALQAAVGTSPWQALDAPVDPQMTAWPKPVTQAPATLRLRQQVDGTAHLAGYHKLLLLTVSTQAP
jgi:hypothetical protein